jgi:4-alpha-glucanotransferase
MLADWWDTAKEVERLAVLEIPRLRDAGVSAGQDFDDRLRDALLETLLHAGSDLVIFPIQDLFGWRERINVPATVGPGNWSWVSPIPVDRLMDDPVARERATTLHRMVVESGRVQALTPNAER